MAVFDEDGVRKKVAHELGEDLSALSLEELAERIAVLRAEIVRIEATIAVKRQSADAASAFFKR